MPGAAAWGETQVLVWADVYLPAAYGESRPRWHGFCPSAVAESPANQRTRPAFASSLGSDIVIAPVPDRAMRHRSDPGTHRIFGAQDGADSATTRLEVLR